MLRETWRTRLASQLRILWRRTLVRRAGRAPPRAWHKADSRGKRRNPRSATTTFSAPFSRRRVASAWTCLGGQCSVSMPEEVGPPNGVSTPKRSFASASSAASQPAKRVRTSRNARARVCAAMRSSTTRAISRSAGPQLAARAATRLACERRITPSSITLKPLAASVAPVVVMSTISSAVPAAGAPSVAPALSTIR